MSRELFGTDGVRGCANVHPMTAEMALRIGAAAGRYFRRDGSSEHRVVIGKDTRLSGYMFENALAAGFTSTGLNVFLLGPVPTPAVGFLTHSLRADAGVMISASHNQHRDNGIKFFGPEGFKLSDEAEAEIGALVDARAELVDADDIGKAQRIDDGRFRYMERVKGTLPARMSLDGLKVVIDCANGAAYRAAPDVLWELGAEIVPIGVAPNGFNINKDCGSTDTAQAAEAVVANGADVGVCLDGDADRVTMVDETGKEINPDQIMALFAGRWAEERRLKGRALVATVVSNLGLERHLADKGIALRRTAVGDRYVVEEMRRSGCNLGGEQSGHIVMTDYATTGDGLIAGLHFLAEMKRSGKPAGVLGRQFETVPQLLRNVRHRGADPLALPAVNEAVAAAEARLSGVGRLLIRKSGTEPVIRVMAESEDEPLMTKVVDDLCGVIAVQT